MPIVCCYTARKRFTSAKRSHPTKCWWCSGWAGSTSSLSRWVNSCRSRSDVATIGIPALRASAFAYWDFPTPGGPSSNKPFSMAAQSSRPRRYAARSEARFKPHSLAAPHPESSSSAGQPKNLKPNRKRKLVDAMRSEWDVSIRRTCRVFEVDTSTHHYKSRRSGQAVLEERIKEICRTPIRYGYRRIHVLLRREGWRHGQTRPDASIAS